MTRRHLAVLLLLTACGSAAPAAAPGIPPAQPANLHPDMAVPGGPPTSAEAPGPAAPPPEEPADTSEDIIPLDSAGVAPEEAAEAGAWTAAKPVFYKYCASCHSKDGAKASKKKLEHFDMTTYPFGGHHAATMAATIRKQLGIGGGKAKMPADQPGAVKGDDLKLVATWCDAWDAAHPAK